MASSCDKRHYGHKLRRTARHLVRASVFDLKHAPATVRAVHDGMVPLLVRAGINRGAIRVIRNPAVAWCGERVPAETNSGIFFVGRLESDKGIDVLARVAKTTRACLHIIGSGPLATMPRLAP